MSYEKELIKCKNCKVNTFYVLKIENPEKHEKYFWCLQCMHNYKIEQIPYRKAKEILMYGV